MAWCPTTAAEAIMFRPLTDEEETEFREYARNNDPENPEHWSVYHPVIRDEWIRRGIRPSFLGSGI